MYDTIHVLLAYYEPTQNSIYVDTCIWSYARLYICIQKYKYIRIAPGVGVLLAESSHVSRGEGSGLPAEMLKNQRHNAL